MQIDGIPMEPSSLPEGVYPPSLISGSVGKEEYTVYIDRGLEHLYLECPRGTFRMALVDFIQAWMDATQANIPHTLILPEGFIRD